MSSHWSSSPLIGHHVLLLVIKSSYGHHWWLIKFFGCHVSQWMSCILNGCHVFSKDVMIVLRSRFIFSLSFHQDVSCWYFFQVALSWSVLQNDLFKRSIQVFPDGGPLLKFHLISCIARRLSSIYMIRYIRTAAAPAPAAASATALAAAPAADPWIHGSISSMMNIIFFYELKNNWSTTVSVRFLR